MRILKHIVILLATAAFAVVPSVLSAQENSLNAYSPYTLYGVGELHTPGTVAQRSMGGVGVAMQSNLVYNPLNPAALGNTMQQSFIFNFGTEGQNFYSKQGDAKTSFNTFNVRDIAIQFPLAKKLGMSASVTPYSSVGYRILTEETNPDVVADIGYVDYYHVGEGSITEAKLAIGWEPFKRFFIGASGMLYVGDLDRSYTTRITAITAGQGTYSSASGLDNMSVSRVMANVGAQYHIIMKPQAALTVGAVYDFGGELKAKTKHYISSNNVYSDTVSLVKGVSPIALPASLSVGIYFHSPKVTTGFDYVYQDWESKNEYDAVNKVGYTNTHTYKFGIQFTPNRGDVRRVLNRWSYRLGARYGSSYLTFQGQKLPDMALTLGVGIPIKLFGTSSIDVGCELGRRGRLSNGLVRDTYFKFSIGMSMFGEDYWFSRYKID
ncbi:MAG: hypothetical protein IKC30_07310 [Rikenellaceae bacterium]|nr:hypothetical protein [Rikenellaceae bacterium]